MEAKNLKMPRKPRRFDRTIALRRAKKGIEQDIKEATLRVFRRGWRRLVPSLRRLRKQDDEGWWDDWEADFEDEFNRVFTNAIDRLAGIEQGWYAGLGIDVTYDPRWILVHHQTGKDITRISQDTRDRVAEQINTWFTTDEGVDTLVGQLSDQFGERRAMLIAINEATTLSSTVTEEMMRNAGLDGWQLYTMLDDYVCDICRPLHGQMFTMRDPMPPDGTHIGCILPRQVVAVPGLSHAAKSFYRGPIIEITTSNGHRLAVTENHPILTSCGWVAAQFIHEGDNVVTHSSPERMAFSIYPDYKHAPAVVEQVFSSLQENSLMMTVTVPTSAEYLHSDGGNVNGNIEVVSPHRELTFARYTPIINQLYQFLLNRTRVFLADKLRKSHFMPLFLSMLAPQCSLMSSGDLSNSLFWGHPSPFDPLRLRLGARSDSMSENDFMDRATVNPVTLGQSKLRNITRGIKVSDFLLRKIINFKRLALDQNPRSLQGVAYSNIFDPQLTRNFLTREAAFIKLNHVTRVSKTIGFAGHVYDLQSDMYSLYACNGIIVKNCRCGAAPVIPGLDYEV